MKLKELKDLREVLIAEVKDATEVRFEEIKKEVLKIDYQIDDLEKVERKLKDEEDVHVRDKNSKDNVQSPEVRKIYELSKINTKQSEVIELSLE